jgi:hypothetical protein
VYYYIFILDQDVESINGQVEPAGVDLLYGPYPTKDDLIKDVTDNGKHPPNVSTRLAHLITTYPSIARIRCLDVTQERCDRYNTRHGTNIPFPPPSTMQGRQREDAILLQLIEPPVQNMLHIKSSKSVTSIFKQLYKSLMTEQGNK